MKTAVSFAGQASASKRLPLSPGVQALAELVRLPNVFTAMSDIGLGWAGTVASTGSWQKWPGLLLLLGASSSLYMAGMVWNDFFDIEQDRRERPFRPLPSGRVSRQLAACLGSGLLLAGVILAGLVGPATGGTATNGLWIAIALAASILCYDGWLKKTWAGPVAMGACRFLNVILGFTLAAEVISWSNRAFIASLVGSYIVGVTWFARTEAVQSHRTALRGAALVMAAALIGALPVPHMVAMAQPGILFPYLLTAFGGYLVVPVGRAIAEPSPMNVQVAVKRCIMGLVVLDAILASALAGDGALIILVLLLPAVYLGRWIYST